MDPIAKRLRQSEARFDPYGYYSDVPRAFRNAVWRFLNNIDPAGLSDEMRELREGLMFACRPRRLLLGWRARSILSRKPQ